MGSFCQAKMPHIWSCQPRISSSPLLLQVPTGHTKVRRNSYTTRNVLLCSSELQMQLQSWEGKPKRASSLTKAPAVLSVLQKGPLGVSSWKERLWNRHFQNRGANIF